MSDRDHERRAVGSAAGLNPRRVGVVPYVIGIVLLVAAQYSLLGCEGELDGLYWDETRFVGVNVAAGTLTQFLQWEIRENVVVLAGDFSFLSGSVTPPAGSAAPRKLQLQVQQKDATGRVVRKFKVNVRILNDGSFKPTQKKFPRMSFSPGQTLVVYTKWKGNDLVPGSVVEFEASIDATEASENPRR